MTVLSLGPDSHPFLRHHALGGRPVLPLAAAADIMARDLQAPFSLSDLTVERGLVVSGNTRVRVEGAVERQLVEVRDTGREVVAFRCRLSEPAAPPRLEDPAGGPPRMSLADFYNRLFHGPMLRGIEDVQAVSDLGLRGVVRTSAPRDLSPVESRERWAVDVLAVDSAFQLAILWALERRGLALLPTRIDHLVMRRPMETASLDVVLRHDGDIDGEATGTIVFGSLEDPCGWIAGIRGRLIPAAVVAPR